MSTETSSTGNPLDDRIAAERPARGRWGTLTSPSRRVERPDPLQGGRSWDVRLRTPRSSGSVLCVGLRSSGMSTRVFEAIRSMAATLGIGSAETLRKWVRRHAGGR